MTENTCDHSAPCTWVLSSQWGAKCNVTVSFEYLLYIRVMYAINEVWEPNGYVFRYIN